MTSPQTFSDYAARLREFIRSQRAVASSDAAFNELALSLFALQFEHNAPYRQFCQSRKISPQGVEHWSQIPAVPTVAFKELELTSLPPEQRARVFHSSGTTAHRPGRHFHDAESLALYKASLLPWFQARVLPSLPSNSIHFLSLTPPPELAPHSSLVHMFATIHREFGASNSIFTGLTDPEGTWTLDLEKSVAVLREAIAANAPVIVMGTAFNFVQLLDHIEDCEISLRLPAGSRVLETGGYKGRSRALPKTELHSLITRLFGVPSTRIVSEYGMSELSSQAYDLQLGSSHAQTPSPSRFFQFPPWARAQIVSPETGREVADGETGLIRIFDLANVRSVLALQTEDLGVRRGDGFELLGRAALAEARGCSLMSL